jgi:hypothetical protein
MGDAAMAFSEPRRSESYTTSRKEIFTVLSVHEVKDSPAFVVVKARGNYGQVDPNDALDTYLSDGDRRPLDRNVFGIVGVRYSIRDL